MDREKNKICKSPAETYYLMKRVQDNILRDRNKLLCEFNKTKERVPRLQYMDIMRKLQI